MTEIFRFNVDVKKFHNYCQMLTEKRVVELALFWVSISSIVISKTKIKKGWSAMFDARYFDKYREKAQVFPLFLI